MSPALAGRFLSTVPLGKSSSLLLKMPFSLTPQILAVAIILTLKLYIQVYIMMEEENNHCKTKIVHKNVLSSIILETKRGNSLVVLWLGLHTAKGRHSIPGGGIKILQASMCT